MRDRESCGMLCAAILIEAPLVFFGLSGGRLSAAQETMGVREEHTGKAGASALAEFKDCSGR